MKLYFAPGACSFVPHTLLEIAGEPFETAMVKLHKGENYSGEYKAFNASLYAGLMNEPDALVQNAGLTGKLYLAGEKFGPLDAYTLTLARWGSIAGVDPAAFPATRGFIGRIAKLPAVARVIERERLPLNLYRPA